MPDNASSTQDVWELSIGSSNLSVVSAISRCREAANVRARWAKRRDESAAAPTTSVLSIDVDADANDTTIVAIILIPVVVVAVITVPASIVSTVLAIEVFPHADLLEVVTDERESIRNGRAVLDECQRARERSAAAACWSRRSGKALRTDRPRRTLRARCSSRTLGTRRASVALQSLQSLQSLRTLRTSRTRVAFRSLWTLRTDRTCRADFALRTSGTLRAGCPGVALRTLSARCTSIAFRALRTCRACGTLRASCASIALQSLQALRTRQTLRAN